MSSKRALAAEAINVELVHALEGMVMAYEADCMARNVEYDDVLNNHTWFPGSYKAAKAAIAKANGE